MIPNWSPHRPSYSFSNSYLNLIIRSVLLLLLVFAGEQVRAATITVPPGGDLQPAINIAQYGDTLILQAGASYESFSDGSPRDYGFNLPNKGAGTGTDADYITIPTSDAGLPGEGVRVSPLNAGSMAKIVANAALTAVNFAAGAHQYRFVGIAFTNKDNTGVGSHSLVAGPAAQPRFKPKQAGRPSSFKTYVNQSRRTALALTDKRHPHSDVGPQSQESFALEIVRLPK
jgi:hypothetical protein